MSNGWTVGKTPNGQFLRKYADISADVINLEVPLLLSLQTLCSPKCTIEFKNRGIQWGNGDITQARITRNRHLSFAWYPVIRKENGTERAQAPLIFTLTLYVNVNVRKS